MAQTKYEVFSKRQRRKNGELPDVYQYGKIPAPLRVQVDFIIRDASGFERDSSLWDQLLAAVHGHLLRVYGRRCLVNNDDPAADLMNFFLTSERTDEVLDVIEIVFRQFDSIFRENPAYLGAEPLLSVDQAIDLLNARFREHGVGYQFESGLIVRIDSELVHQEVVKPVLAALTKAPFKGTLAEFTKAHEHYRHGSYKECLNDCNKAF